ncbi:MAG: hypothetical protein ACTTJL_04940 [Hoylesella enoeca]|uniref:hypothetical protein n=1 Tax=Hoylesella enoeca TaxID=76123 RepID=UPI003FA168D9
MIIFKVIKRKVGVGPKKGQDAYVAEPKSINKFSVDWLIDRIVRETSTTLTACTSTVITSK